MIQKLRAIVLRKSRYTDNTVIINAYTLEHGPQAFIASGMNNPRLPMKEAFFQPFILLDLVSYYKPQGSIHRLKEAHVSPLLNNILFDVLHTTVAMFLAEVVAKCIKEEEENIALFDFLERKILELELAQDYELALFPLTFLIDFAVELGFQLLNNFSDQNIFFNLREGSYSSRIESSEYSLGSEESEFLSQLIDRHQRKNFVKAPKNLRNDLIERMLVFYQIHVPSFLKVKSFEILKQVLS